MTLIRNSGQIKQRVDFTGVQNGPIHPTDIDAVLEFDNEVLILIEIKRINNAMATGQKLVLERICDSWHTKKAIVLFVTHEQYNSSKLIHLHECKVFKYYYKGQWRMRKGNTDFNFVLNELGKFWNINKLKI